MWRGGVGDRWSDDAAAAELGQQLFFERRYSGPLSIGNDGLVAFLESLSGEPIPDAMRENTSNP